MKSEVRDSGHGVGVAEGGQGRVEKEWGQERRNKWERGYLS